jgi:hypothetical protein
VDTKQNTAGDAQQKSAGCAAESFRQQLCAPWTSYDAPTCEDGWCAEPLCSVRTHVVIDAAPHDGVPGWGCATLLPGCEPLPGAALELQQDQQARKLRRRVVGQRTQNKLIDIVDMNPAGTGQDKERETTVSNYWWEGACSYCGQWWLLQRLLVVQACPIVAPASLTCTVISPAV